jgi:hypothetical protein
MRTLIFFLLFMSLAHAAQKDIVVPVGTTTYGPFAVSVLERRHEIFFVATTNTHTMLTLTLEYSVDKGANWIQYGRTTHPGGLVVPTPIGSTKLLPKGVIATHIRVLAAVTGTSVTIAEAPTISPAN